jgi:hypothetical protein
LAIDHELASVSGVHATTFSKRRATGMHVAGGRCMSDDPVQIEVTSPPYFARLQLLLRIVLAIVLGWFGVTAGWLACMLYLVLPVVAAIAISSSGSERYARDTGPRVWRVLAWLMQFSAYMALLVDRFPTGDGHPVHVTVRVTSRMTAGAALFRLVTSIPSAFVLMVLAFVGSILWVFAALVVLFGAAMPEWILGYQRGILRWQTRLLAYHASLVDEYPPFTMDTGREDGELAASAG